MGGKTVPVLDRLIREWRSRMRQEEAFTGTDLDELESHLRDEVEALQNKGLSEEEAFLISARRLGDGDRLGEEFLKINSGTIWKQRIFWMVGGYFLFNFFLTLIHTAQSAYLFWIPWGNVPTSFAGPLFRVPVVPGVLAMFLIWLLYFRLTQKSSKIGRIFQFVHAERRGKILGILLLLAALSIALAGREIFLAFFARMVTPQLMGQIILANGFFDIIFKLFLAMFFVRLAAWFLSQKKERA